MQAQSRYLCKTSTACCYCILHTVPMHIYIAWHNKSEDCNACHSFCKSVSYSNFRNYYLCFSHSFQSFQSNKWHPSIICMTNYKTMCEIVIVLWVVPFGSKMHFSSVTQRAGIKWKFLWIPELNRMASLSLLLSLAIQKRTAVSVWLSL